MKSSNWYAVLAALGVLLFVLGMYLLVTAAPIERARSSWRPRSEARKDVAAGPLPAASNDRLPALAQADRCRVTRIERECDPGGTTCREVRTPEYTPPVPPGADLSSATVALAAYTDRCELTPSFDSTGRIQRLTGSCMGRPTRFDYEGCEAAAGPRRRSLTP